MSNPVNIAAVLDAKLRRRMRSKTQRAFLEQEQMNGQFLEKYVHWVNTRPRSAEYDARERIIPP